MKHHPHHCRSAVLIRSPHLAKYDSNTCKHFAVFYFVCWAQSAIFQPVLGESVELKVPPWESCWTRGVSPLPYIAFHVRKCLTLSDQYFRKLLLVSLPISQADEDVITVCVCVRMRLELKWIRQQSRPIAFLSTISFPVRLQESGTQIQRSKCQLRSSGTCCKWC